MKNIVPVTDLQRQASQIIGNMSDSDEPVIITQRGRTAAVLLTAKRYAEIEADLKRLDELELLEMVEKSRQEITDKKTLSHEEVKRRLKFSENE
jgi:prevent-host-death family protein